MNNPLEKNKPKNKKAEAVNGYINFVSKDTFAIITFDDALHETDTLIRRKTDVSRLKRRKIKEGQSVKIVLNNQASTPYEKMSEGELIFTKTPKTDRKVKKFMKQLDGLSTTADRSPKI